MPEKRRRAPWPPRFVTPRCTAVGIILLSTCLPAVGAPPPRPAEAERSQRELVQVADGRLTVDVREASLSEVLEEIARQSGLVLKGHTSIDVRIDAQFDRLPLEHGLRVILDGQRYAVRYSLVTGDDGRAMVRVPSVLWIFPPHDLAPPEGGPANDGADAGSGDGSLDLQRLRAVLESAEDAWDKEDALEAIAEAEDPQVALPLVRFALTDRDEDVRLAAVEALATIGGEGAAEALEIALRDPESWVREGAIETLEAIGGDRAAQSLAVALQDEDADLREQAVDALGEIGSPTALQLLEYAWASDTDEAVRAAAEAWLEELSHQSPRP